MEFRLTAFILTLGLFCLFEVAFPRRQSDRKRFARWPGNLGLIVAAQILIRLFIPLTTVAVTLWAQDKQMGLFYLIDLHPTLSFILTLFLFDLVIYWQHVMFHRVSWLWRMHQVHHADRFLDSSTALRFHPLEIMISLFIKFGFIVLLGPSVAAVITFEIILSSMAIFNHSNVYLPQKLDRFLRKFVVTPDMHRVHHSWEGQEMNRNFGFNLSWWDYLFKSYLDKGFMQEESFPLGLKFIDEEHSKGIWNVLVQPFKSYKTQDHRPQNV